MLSPVLLILSLTITFIIVFFATKIWIRYLRKINMVVKDVHKKEMPLVPTSGGLAVMAGIFAGLMIFIFIETFFNGSEINLIALFAATTVILLISFVGFLDDLIIRKDFKETAGLRRWQKPLLTLAAAIPLMVLQIGDTSMALPFIGSIDFGIIYPLVLIPLGVVGASNMVNMLAGFNGFEAGMGIIYTGMLGIYAYANGSDVAALIAFATFAALLAFLFYNKYPAKILPGDSMTYLLGAIIVCIAVVGNMEKASIIAAIPFIVEFFLKARGKFKKTTIGILNKEGKIQSKYKGIYSIPHIFTRTGKYTEKQIVVFMVLIELFFCILIWFV